MIYPRFPVLFSPPATRSGEKAATAQPARAESGTESLKAADPPARVRRMKALRAKNIYNPPSFRYPDIRIYCDREIVMPEGDAAWRGDAYDHGSGNAGCAGPAAAPVDRAGLHRMGGPLHRSRAAPRHAAHRPVEPQPDRAERAGIPLRRRPAQGELAHGADDLRVRRPARDPDPVPLHRA